MSAKTLDTVLAENKTLQEQVATLTAERDKNAADLKTVTAERDTIKADNAKLSAADKDLDSRVATKVKEFGIVHFGSAAAAAGESAKEKTLTEQCIEAKQAMQKTAVAA